MGNKKIVDKFDKYSYARQREKALRLASDEFKEHCHRLHQYVNFANEYNRTSSYEVPSNLNNHYLFIGKEGTGKRDAAQLLYMYFKKRYISMTFQDVDVSMLLNSTNGFPNALEETFSEKDNTTFFVRNAELLSQKGLIGNTTGIEALTMAIKDLSNVVVVLSGKTDMLTEMLNMSEDANDLFPASRHFYFHDADPCMLMAETMQWISRYRMEITEEAVIKLRNYYEHVYALRGAKFNNFKFVEDLFFDEILGNLSQRIDYEDNPSDFIPNGPRPGYVSAYCDDDDFLDDEISSEDTSEDSSDDDMKLDEMWEALDQECMSDCDDAERESGLPDEQRVTKSVACDQSSWDEFLKSEGISFESPKITEANAPSVEEQRQKLSYTIIAADIPDFKQVDPGPALQRLDSLVGLEQVKKNIFSHTSLVHLNKVRADKGMFNKMPPMHMIFTGNPGTGKTTVAKYLGEIYHGIGVLSSGHLVETDRSKLVGQFLGDTEKNTLNAISRASGGVLFIDEAYNLFVNDPDRRDFGHRVIETLLTYLGNDNGDMIVVLAGYTNEMTQLLESNPGLKSRFSYIFQFDDYAPEQLMQIGKIVLDGEKYHLTPDAESKLAKYVINAYDNKDEHFGNGRFISRLIKSHIIPAACRRLSQSGDVDTFDVERLSEIVASDIPETEVKNTSLVSIDETMLKDALLSLDSLISLQNAKNAIHDLVDIARYRHKQGKSYFNSDDLILRFVGDSGTGKSTVAKILARVFQSLGVLKRGHYVSLNVDEFIHSDRPMNIVETYLKRAADGLLFFDLDAPDYAMNSFEPLHRQIRNKIRELELHVAVVYAETKNENDMLVSGLAQNGISSFNHSIVFENLTGDELLAIFGNILQERFDLDIDEKARVFVGDYIKHLCLDKKLANARTIMLLAKHTAQQAQLRMAKLPEMSQEVLFEDVENLEWSGGMGRTKVGFL